MLKYFRHVARAATIRGPRIFCIGFNKTGTLSLHSYFEEAGLISRHDAGWPPATRAWGARHLLLAAQCYSDGGGSDFLRTRQMFPDAVFVINDRDERAWMRSRVKHILQYQGGGGLKAAFDAGVRSWMALDLRTDADMAFTRWIVERRLYLTQAYTYFEGDPRALPLRVTEDADWLTKLNAFLDRHGVSRKPVTSDHFHGNNLKDAAVNVDPAALEALYARIDAKLAEFGPDPTLAFHPKPARA